MSTSVKIRGIKLVYEDIGRRFPIVMIHGQPFNRSMWNPQKGVLQDSYRLIIPDLRGYGESDIPDGITLLDELALDLEALLQHLNVEKALLMGLSMGGQIALEFCKLFPDRVAGLVLADTDCRAEDEAGYARRLSLANKLEQEGMIAFTQERIHHFISPHSMAHFPQVVAHLQEMMESTNALGSARVQRGRAEREDLTPVLEKLKIPILFVVGSEDEFTPVSTAQFMHEKATESTLVIVEQAGHIPNLEQPERFNAALLSFLNTHFSY